MIYIICLFGFLNAHADWSNDSEAGLVIAGGNSKTQTLNLRQNTIYHWGPNMWALNARLLKASNNEVETAFKWGLGARYEREWSSLVSGLVNQDLDSDKFAGYNQRYATDLGIKLFIMKSASLNLATELGLRHTDEHRTDDTNFVFNSARIYIEAERKWEKRFSARYWVEFIPSLTHSDEFQVNTEASISSILTDVFSVKTAYLLRYNNIPSSITAIKSDTLLTTALVAKF